MKPNVIAETILSIATERGPEKSTCPSEIARQLFPSNWREHMEAVRSVAIALQREGKVQLTQQGQPVDPERLKGPIRIRIV